MEFTSFFITNTSASVLHPSLRVRCSRLIVALILFLFSAPPADASTSGSAITGDIYKFDTWVVASSSGPNALYFSDVASQSVTASITDGPNTEIANAIQAALTPYKRYTVLSWDTYDLAKLTNENVLVLRYTISGQHDTVDGKQITIASIGLKLEHYEKGGATVELPTLITPTYSFIVPNDKAAFRRKFVEGARSLLLGLLCSNFDAPNRIDACNQAGQGASHSRDVTWPNGITTHLK